MHSCVVSFIPDLELFNFIILYNAKKKYKMWEYFQLYDHMLHMEQTVEHGRKVHLFLNEWL